MHLTLGFLQVTLKYTYPRGGTIIYQRPVPKPLWNRYANKNVKHDLKTRDWIEAERAVSLLNKRYDTEFAGLKAAPRPSWSAAPCDPNTSRRSTPRGHAHGAPTGSRRPQPHWPLCTPQGTLRSTASFAMRPATKTQAMWVCFVARYSPSALDTPPTPFLPYGDIRCTSVRKPERQLYDHRVPVAEARRILNDGIQVLPDVCRCRDPRRPSRPPSE